MISNINLMYPKFSTKIKKCQRWGGVDLIPLPTHLDTHPVVGFVMGSCMISHMNRTQLTQSFVSIPNDAHMGKI